MYDGYYWNCSCEGVYMFQPCMCPVCLLLQITATLSDSPVCAGGVYPLYCAPVAVWVCCSRCHPALHVPDSPNESESAKRTRPDTQTDPTAPSWRKTHILTDICHNETPGEHPRKRKHPHLLLSLMGKPLCELVKSTSIFCLDVASTAEKLREVWELLLFHLHLRVQNLYLVCQLCPQVWDTQIQRDITVIQANTYL